MQLVPSKPGAFGCPSAGSMRAAAASLWGEGSALGLIARMSSGTWLRGMIVWILITAQQSPRMSRARQPPKKRTGPAGGGAAFHRHTNTNFMMETSHSEPSQSFCPIAAAPGGGSTACRLHDRSPGPVAQQAPHHRRGLCRRRQCRLPRARHCGQARVAPGPTGDRRQQAGSRRPAGSRPGQEHACRWLGRHAHRQPVGGAIDRQRKNKQLRPAHGLRADCQHGQHPAGGRRSVHFADQEHP